jgi:glycosyltransferase involved in cell wall biosynthesis
MVVKFIKPKRALTPSPSLKKYWDSIHMESELIPLLTDLSIFKPLTKKTIKIALREKYNFSSKDFIISHMGHLNEGRNLKTLIPLQKSGIQVIIISSSSTPEDAKGSNKLREELLETGIKIIERYIENIQEIYQLSDVYIFPVVDENSSIGMPLSVLEARACGIPVITTNYGSVRKFLDDDFGGIKYSSQEDFLDSVKEIQFDSSKNYNISNVFDLNNFFFDTIYRKIEN